MLNKHDLLSKYRKLPRREKEIIGSALVKVNLGVALPVDQKRIAEFLKGSPYIAKKEGLDDLISFMHSMDAVPENTKSANVVQRYDKSLDQDATEEDMEDSLDALRLYEEDEATTAEEDPEIFNKIDKT